MRRWLACAPSLLVVAWSVAAGGADETFPERVALSERPVPNLLTAEETAAGWRLLFDGATGAGWHAADSEAFPGDGWTIEDGVLTIRAARFYEFRSGGDLFTRERFGDFVLDFEFQLTEGANSGVKYRADVRHQLGFVHSLGCEFQILDDARHPDAEAGHDGNRGLASLYDMIPAEPRPFRGVGAWNHGRVHLERGRLAHYLNGVRVLLIELGSPDWEAALAGSKFADREGFCGGPRGHVVLQDHGDEVRFRNLRIHPLEAAADDS